MALKTQHGAPAVVSLGPEGSFSLEPLPILEEGEYDEKWVQNLLFSQPSLIPIEEIEPAFSGAVPVCRELGTRVGPLDLVYINEQGLLTLVECKLWRNPEARRKVVGQILDYAQEISRWSYSDLEAAVLKAQNPAGKSLWDIARNSLELTDEAVFIDRVSRHLRHGSFLLLVVGDGIRENTENIGAYLQKNSGLGFAFGLVEQKIFQLQEGRILVLPRILAKTGN